MHRQTVHRRYRFTLIDVKPCHKAIPLPFERLPASARTVATALLAIGHALPSRHKSPAPLAPAFRRRILPPQPGAPRQIATAWTVFTGTKPEPMQVEILGVLRGARGPGQDMILAQLHGAKPEYTGVVAGMSGSPVYIGDKLLGSLSYRIGQFTKDPIAGITPIEQMLEVSDMPVSTQWASAPASTPIRANRRTALRRSAWSFRPWKRRWS